MYYYSKRKNNFSFKGRRHSTDDKIVFLWICPHLLHRSPVPSNSPQNCLRSLQGISQLYPETSLLSYRVSFPLPPPLWWHPLPGPKGASLLTWPSKIPTLLLVDSHQHLSQETEDFTRPPSPIFAPTDLLLTFPFVTTVEDTATFQSQ